METADLARDRLLMALLISAVVHLLVVFGPLGAGVSGAGRTSVQSPLAVELTPSAPRRSQPLQLVTGAAPAASQTASTPTRPDRRYIDATTEDDAAARYLRDWIGQAEALGNRHYPAALVEAGVRGEVGMAVTVNAAGEVMATRMLGAAAPARLQRAARRLVHAAAPFPAVPAEVLRGREAIVITRRWSFGAAAR